MSPALRELIRLAALAVLVLSGVSGFMWALWGPDGLLVN